jgi:epoxyqueuosine reductase
VAATPSFLPTQALKQEAERLGFLYCGVAKAEYLAPEAARLQDWLARNQHGEMQYMVDTFEVRVDPRKLLPNAQSVVTVLLNYYPAPADRQPPDAPKISTYAYGEDYHRIVKSKLQLLLQFIKENYAPQHGTIHAHVGCDSAPVMEKAWAQRAGAGWIGKNTNLLRQGVGSFFFIGTIILDIAFAPDAPVEDMCGTCTACIDACPTQALTPYAIDATKCISYLTIEHTSPVPEAFRGKLAGWAYGCDICQDVCPWNRFAQAHSEPFFKPLPHTRLSAQQWRYLNRSQFKKHTRATAMWRLRPAKWLDNIDAATQKQQE